MTVRWTAAVNDLERIGEYIEKHHPAFGSTPSILYSAAESLGVFPLRGRAGRVPGTREFVMAPFPYVIVYTTDQHAVFIARVLHTSQLWPPG